MAAAGLDPKAVKTILISHLHGDHHYGLMNIESNAQVFPDADIVVPAGLKCVTRGSRVARSWTDAQRPRPAHQRRSRPGKTSGPLRENPSSCPMCTPFRCPAIARNGRASGQFWRQTVLITATWSILRPTFPQIPVAACLDQDPQMAVENAKEDLRSRGRRQAHHLGTHWLMPNAGTLAKDGNSYVSRPRRNRARVARSFPRRRTSK